MKKGIFRHLPISILLFLNVAFAATSDLTSINFRQKGEVSQLDMVFSSNDVSAKKFHVSEDKQIILDLKDVKASDKVMRAFDTSEFSGSIVFVSAYKKPGNTNDIRIALQLRDNVRSVLKRTQNHLILEVENRFGVFDQSQAKLNETFEDKLKDEEVVAGKLLVPKSEAIEDILENLTLSGRKKYIGKRITLNVKDVTVEDLLRMIAEASGFNIILTKEVKKLPPLTLNLTNVPWDQALDTILSLNKLVAKKNGIILMIQTLQSATADAKAAADAKLLSLKQEPLVTKIFPISFAAITSLEKILKEYLTEKRGNLSLDERTNSIIIKDTPDTIERMRKIIEVLDTQTPQVLVESKIVEVRENSQKELGLRQGVNFGYDPVGDAGTGDPASIGPNGSTASTGTDGGPGFSFNSAPELGAGFIGVSITKFNRLFNLNFTLQLLESETKVKVISSPKIITQNKQKAKIEAKDTDFFSVQNGTGDDATFTFEEQEATVSLQVVPQITNEGSISMEIEVGREEFGGRAVANGPQVKLGNTITTNVLVDNGSTIVLGGLYSYRKQLAESGVPFLKDIPIIGWLFRSMYAPATTKRELVIFITPRIINQEEAGLDE